MMTGNEEKQVPEEYTKRSRRIQQTRESKYGGRNKEMINEEVQDIRGNNFCKKRALCLSN